MKLLKETLVALFTLFALFTITSCDFLDVQDYYEDTIPYDSIFHNKEYAQRYLWSIAATFPDEGAILSNPYTPGPTATDEGIVAYGTGEFRGEAFVMGEVTANDLKGLDNWTDMYKVIRRVNILLSRSDEIQNISPRERYELTSYARFMRAYAYYHILMNFGPVILIGDQVLSNNEATDYYNTYRATYDESVDYICSELEEAAKYMPVSVLSQQFGRPTRGAAYGLIARLRLQQASPLYNGGDAARRCFGTWKRESDGEFYVSQAYSEEKWAIAAAAAKRVIDMGDEGIYALHTVPADGNTPSLPASVPAANFPDGAGGIDHFRSYSEMFNGEAVPRLNKEYVWGRMSEAVRGNLSHVFAKNLLGGWNGLSITQKVVDAYRMDDGRDITPEEETGIYTGPSKEFSGYRLNSNICNMFLNREMRFYASVGFSGRFWTCSSTTESAFKNVTITYHVGGTAPKSDAQGGSDYPLTGYVITKFVHPDDALKGNGSTKVAKPYGIIRYAEILLSYAEALNNLTGEYTIKLPYGIDEERTYTVSRNQNEIKKHFNQVRFRAGLPGLTDTELSSTDEVQKQIVRERFIEFLFENRRYFDVRRWGIYETVDAEPVMGMNVDAGLPDFYNVIRINHQRTRDRITDKKMVFLPIPNDEVKKVKNLSQNPGW